MTTGKASVGSAGTRRLPVADLVLYLVALLFAGIVIVPLGYVILGGFRTTGQLAADPIGLPNPWLVSNYTDIVASPSFWRIDP